MTPAPDATSPASQVGEAVSVSYDAETGEFTATPPGAPIPAVQSGAVAWRWRKRSQGPHALWSVGKTPIDTGDDGETARVFEVQPLYAAPQSEPLPGGVGERDRLVALIARNEAYADAVIPAYRFSLAGTLADAILAALSGKEQG